MSAPASGGGSLAGTGSLVRLALRRDRIVLSTWVASLVLVPAAMPGAYDTYYPSAADRAGLTASVASNPSVAVLYGHAYDLSSAGGFTAWRIGGVLAVFIGLMAVFTVTRHTRVEEDSGRAELLVSTGIGRHALLSAAIVVAGGTSLVIGILLALGLVAVGLPAGGSFALGLSTAGMGLVATGVAALACQLAAYSRSANGIGAAVIGAAFLLRAVGDSTTSLGWLSWLSPIGWAEKVQAFAGDRWWVLALPLGAAAVTTTIAFWAVNRRDLGVGILPPRPGPARGGARLASPLALGWRLQRGALLGWLVAMLVSGAVLGSIASGITELVGDSAQTQEAFARLGGSARIVDAYLASIAGLFAMITAFYGVQALVRLRAEETGQRLEPVLATPARRLQVAAGHLVFAFGGSAVLVLAAGLATGLAHGLRTDDVLGTTAEMAGATAAQIPATWLILAVGVTLFGLAPKLTVASWAIAGVALAISVLGPTFDLPTGVLDISPYSHVPKLPGASVTALPLAVLGALAMGVLSLGLVGFRRRDLT